jgi:hypothetical protein
MGVQVAASSALSVAANSKSADIVIGSTYQYIPADGTLYLYARPSATGLNAQITVSGVNVVPDQVISITGTAGALSKADHEICSIDVTAGSRVETYFRNTTGGAITVDCIVEFEPSE